MFFQEFDDEQPIRFSRTKKKNPTLKEKKATNTFLDESTDEDLDNFFDDQANDDYVVSEKDVGLSTFDLPHLDDFVLESTYDYGESTSDIPHLDDFIDESTDDYDYTDDFIDDGPLVDEKKDNDEDSDN